MTTHQIFQAAQQMKDKNTIMINKYTIKELRHLRDIMAIGFDNIFADDKYGTDRGLFNIRTALLFTWIEKIERNGKIEELLSTLNT